MSDQKHPIQPVVKDANGVLRFKKNSIVDFLAAGRMNDIACMGFSSDDREQLAQLIGYSLGGFRDLSYTSDETYQQALLSWEKIK